MAVHKLMRRNARKCLKVFSSNSKMSPRQGNSSIFLDIGRLGARFLLPYCQSPLPLWKRSELFQGSCRKGYPYGFKDGGSRGDRGLFLDNLHHFLSQARKRLVPLGFHLGIHFLVKFGCHLCMTKRYNNNNKREKMETHSFL